MAHVQLPRAVGYLAAANLMGVGAVGASLALRPKPEELQEETERVKARLEALRRASRLATTVATVALDYKAQEWREMLRGDASSLEVKSASLALRKAQDEQEAAGLMVERASSAAERREGMARAAEARRRVLDAAARVERAETDAGTTQKDTHARNAARLLSMARSNGGVYLKVAQHCAQLDYLLPEAYTKAFSSCLDDAPRSSWADARAVVREELGEEKAAELLEALDPEPVASASLAQVHVGYVDLAKEEHALHTRGRFARFRARFFGGRGTTPKKTKVAVKIQHRGLRETSVGDLDACAGAVRVVAWLFPDFRLGWLVDEISPHLPIELDFEREAAHCKRAARQFAAWPDVAVPSVVDGLTSKRVLTMTFEEGINGTHRDEIRAAGVDPAEAATLVTRALCHQLFREGFVQCDPHAANVLIAPAPLSRFGRLRASVAAVVSSSSSSSSTGVVATAAPRLVLLDHGLYRDLSDDFRLEYARLWRALALQDAEGIAASAAKLGVGSLYPLFAAMLTRRSWDDIIANPNAHLARDGDSALIRGYAQRYAKEITTVLDRVPRQMLLLLKMSDCLRHLEAALGNTDYSHVLTAHACADALYAHDRDLRAYARVKLRLFAYDIRLRISRWRGPPPSKDALLRDAQARIAVPDNVSGWAATPNNSPS